MYKNSNIEIRNIIQKYFNKACNDRAKYYLSGCGPEYEIKISKLREYALKDEMEHILNENLDCPIKFAKTFFEKINEKTIKKAFENINYSDYFKSSDLLGISEIIIDLNNKCPYISEGTNDGNILRLHILANIFITLGLSKELFQEYVNSCFADIKTSRRLNIDDIWEIELKSPKGIICKYCVKDWFNSDFFEHKAERSYEND